MTILFSRSKASASSRTRIVVLFVMLCMAQLASGCEQTPRGGSEPTGSELSEAGLPIGGKGSRGAVLQWKLQKAEIEKAVMEFEESPQKQQMRVVKKDVAPTWGATWLVRGASGDLYRVAERNARVVEVRYQEWFEREREPIMMPCARHLVKVSWEQAVEKAEQFVSRHWGSEVFDGLTLLEGFEGPNEFGGLCRYGVWWTQGCTGEIVMGSRDVIVDVDAATGHVLTASLEDAEAPEHINVDAARFRMMLRENLGHVPGLTVDCIRLNKTYKEDGTPQAIWASYPSWSCKGDSIPRIPPCQGKCQFIVNAISGEIIDKSCS